MLLFFEVDPRDNDNDDDVVATIHCEFREVMMGTRSSFFVATVVVEAALPLLRVLPLPPYDSPPRPLPDDMMRSHISPTTDTHTSLSPSSVW